MSRLTAGSVLVAMAVVALTLPVLASGYSYADDFSSGGYHGSTGSETWTAPWTEIGESDGPNAGSVTVSDSDLCTLDPCLLVQGLVGVNNVGIARKIELAAGDSADLRYDIDFPGGVLVEGSALVQASADGGSWKTLATHSPGTAGTFRVSLPNASSTIDIRFVTSGLSLLGSMAIDSVVINVARPATTTTTSTTTTSSSTSLTLVTTPLPTTLTLPTTSLPLITTTTTATSTTSLPTTTTTRPAPPPHRFGPITPPPWRRGATAAPPPPHPLHPPPSPGKTNRNQWSPRQATGPGHRHPHRVPQGW